MGVMSIPKKYTWVILLMLATFSLRSSSRPCCPFGVMMSMPLASWNSGFSTLGHWASATFNGRFVRAVTEAKVSSSGYPLRIRLVMDHPVMPLAPVISEQKAARRERRAGRTVYESVLSSHFFFLQRASEFQFERYGIRVYGLEVKMRESI